MSEQPKIIHPSIIKEGEQIKEMLKDPNTMGVIRMKSRRTGARFLQNYIFNTQDAEVIEPKQLPNTHSPNPSSAIHQDQNNQDKKEDI